jgi:hypothetical protein
LKLSLCFVLVTNSLSIPAKFLGGKIREAWELFINDVMEREEEGDEVFFEINFCSKITSFNY